MTAIIGVAILAKVQPTYVQSCNGNEGVKPRVVEIRTELYAVGTQFLVCGTDLRTGHLGIVVGPPEHGDNQSLYEAAYPESQNLRPEPGTVLVSP